MAARVIVGLAMVGLLAQPGLAQAQQFTEQDQTFAEEAAEGGLKEVQFGELAQRQAGDPLVAEFGQQMVKDHSKANEQLKEIAEQKGLEVPQELADDAQQQYDELEGLSGAAFGQAYMEEMVKDHQEDISKFEEQAASGKDEALKGFAEQTLPTLREHLQLAREVQANLDGQSQ